MRTSTGAALAAITAVLAGCAGGIVEPAAEAQLRDPVLDLDTSIQDMVEERQVGGVTFGNRRGEAFVGSVNRHLWLASLDTLSFLPISATDPFSGVIATDWGGVTDTDTERFRVTAFVTDVALSADSLRVAVFREVRGPGGAWVAAPVATETPRQIEDSILMRARQLRLAEHTG